MKLASRNNVMCVGRAPSFYLLSRRDVQNWLSHSALDVCHLFNCIFPSLGTKSCFFIDYSYWFYECLIYTLGKWIVLESIQGRWCVFIDLNISVLTPLHNCKASSFRFWHTSWHSQGHYNAHRFPQCPLFKSDDMQIPLILLRKVKNTDLREFVWIYFFSGLNGPLLKRSGTPKFWVEYVLPWFTNFAGMTKASVVLQKREVHCTSIEEL